MAVTPPIYGDDVIEQVELTAYGRPATEVLARAITLAKIGRALAPVTVIVPSNFAGLVARHLLGGGLAGSAGLANVAFMTPFRLAELLTAELMFDGRALSNPVLGAAVRRAVADDPGPYREVADHPATEAALARRFAELSNLSPEATATLSTQGGGWAAEAFGFQRAISSRLANFHDEATMVGRAASRTDLAAVLVPFGHLVWLLPEPSTAPICTFIGAALRCAPSTVIVGSSGDTQADAAVWATCRRAGVSLPDAVPTAGVPSGAPVADSIISATDADEETRAVIRRIVALAESGVRLDRIGVFVSTTDPYLSMLEQQFAAANLPANSPSRRTLCESVAGRTLLAALSLPRERWRRDRVMAVVSGAPVRHGDRSTRPSSWELLSRRAGIVGGLGDWYRKLEGRAAALSARLATVAPEHSSTLAALRDEIEDAGQLRRFVEQLDAGVMAVHHADGWSTKAAAAHELLRQLLGEGHTHAEWPQAEADAFDAVETALARLALLDDLEPSPDAAVFVRALTSELDVARGRTGRFGEGIMVAPLASATGHDLDAVFVLGCAEGSCPAPRRDDPLIPDSVRALTGGELLDRSSQVHEQHRRFLAALASAPSGARTLSFARGDLRRSRRNLPSRWLLDSASSIAGTTVRSTEFERLDVAEVEIVASQLSGLLGASAYPSLVERDAAAVARFATSGGRALDHPAVDQVRRGVQAQHARRSLDFTEWDGNLGDHATPPTLTDALSASRLEVWASCGFRYYLGYLLGLGRRDEPELVTELSPLDRGTAVHEILERFFGQVIAEGAPDPDVAWSVGHRELLQRIAGEVLDQLEASGRTGRAVHWRSSRSDVLATLDGFLTSDDLHRSSTRSRPERVEVPFGMDGADPVTIEVDGRTLSFRGSADRIDRADDGRVLVSDYKTGRGSKFGELDTDPVRGGTTLQLGLYAEAAMAQLGSESAEAHYWMIDPESEYRRYGYPWTAERRERFLEVLGAIVDGITAGVFPAVTGEWDIFRRTHQNCTYCDFDSVCPSSRGEQAAAKVNAPELRRRDVLAIPQP